jgi:anthranilate phosphoribosyltransferase
MFAPKHHSAMRHAIGPRKEMGVRTIFNILGPLTNPAGAPNQLMGVFSRELVEPLANVFNSLGSHHVMVVNAEDGLDEISIAADTHVAELKDGQVTSWTIKPEEYGCRHENLDGIRVENADESLEMICSVFTNNPGPAMDIVLLNAGAAIYVAGLTDSIADGIERAREVIASEKAAEKFADLIALSNQLALKSE